MTEHTGDLLPGRVAYPLAALVGSEEMQLALLLCAVDPGIGGVLLRGEKGSGKTTAARGLAEVLPGDAPFVELPLGATEDRVVGAFDLRAALGGGAFTFQPGLLHTAHGGVLYVDEVNLLADHLVDVLLDAAATGVNRVERDGISHAHSSRFVMVGSMNPEEGDLRPQLLDRFGLSVTVAAPTDPVVRAEAVRRRLAFDADPEGFRARWAEAGAALAARLAAARSVPLAPGTEVQVARLCAEAGAEGLRADLVICRAAAALAGWEGRPEAGEAEVRRVAPLALAHRRSSPWSPTGVDAASLDALLDDAFGDDPPPEGPAPAAAAGDGDAPDVPASGEGAPGQPPDAPAAPGGDGDPATSPPPPPPPFPEAPPAPTGLLDPARRRPSGPPDGRTTRAAGRRSGGDQGGDRGRLVGSRRPEPDAPVTAIAAGATVMAAAGRRASLPRPPAAPPLRPATVVASGPGTAAGLEVLEEDLRQAVRLQPEANLVVLAVDTSGSMGIERRLVAAREAVLSLLVDAYQRRDRVAVVAFRGEEAEVVLRPTGSTEVARARLGALPTGGRTPLSVGIELALRTATTGGDGGYRPMLVLVSDGRATWAPEGSDPLPAALAAADAVRRAAVDALVVDCETGAPRLGLAAQVAEAMGGRCVAADSLTGDSLAGAVREGLRQRSRTGTGGQ